MQAHVVKSSRPVTFVQEIADEFLERIGSGETIRTICADAHMPSNKTIWYWTHAECEAPPSWRNDYARARQRQADAFVADTIALADLTDETAHNAGITALNNLPDSATSTEKRRAYFYAKKRSIEGTKLMIGARQWVASRMAPHRWGDRVTVEHRGDQDNPISIDLSALTTEQLEQIAVIRREIEATTQNAAATPEIEANAASVEELAENAEATTQMTRATA
jgi:hypothetical protein